MIESEVTDEEVYFIIALIAIFWLVLEM